jgi:hypothetical protein
MKALVVGLVVALVPLSCSAGSLAADNPPAAGRPDPAGFHLVRPLAAPRTLQLASLNGGIRVSLADDGNADVRATVSGKDAARVRVVTREEPGGIAVCMMYAGEPDDGCRLGQVEHHRRGEGDIDARVDFVARIPRGAALVAQTMNGAISARSLEGDVRAETMNGNVDVATTGAVHASTMNGSIDAAVAAPPRSALSFETNNGAVRVRLPAEVDADVDAQTMSGDIRTSFPMRIDSVPFGVGPKSGHARLGKGGVPVVAHTLRGDVELRTGA